MCMVHVKRSEDNSANLLFSLSLSLVLGSGLGLECHVPVSATSPLPFVLHLVQLIPVGVWPTETSSAHTCHSLLTRSDVKLCQSLCKSERGPWVCLKISLLRNKYRAHSHTPGPLQPSPWLLHLGW